MSKFNDLASQVSPSLPPSTLGRVALQVVKAIRFPARFVSHAASLAALGFMLASATAHGAQAGGLGRPATDAEIAAWDIDVRPDGIGLPAGQGDAQSGEEIFTDLCAACHGDFGEGLGRYPALAGGQGTLTDRRPVKTVGSYWPYLSTLFDYIRRAQPFGAPGTLSDDEIYSVIAYILYLNDLADDDLVLGRDNLAAIRLPNEAGFTGDSRPDELFGDVCMTDCGDTRSVRRRASDLGIE